LSYKKYIFFAFAAVVLVFFVVSHRAKEDEKQNRAAKYKAEKQVAFLSPKVERDWIIYVQKRLEKQIIRDGQNLKVLNSAYMGAEPRYSYVSVNFPYRIDCNDKTRMGLSLSFGTGNEGDIFVNITGRFSPDSENEPDIDVPLHSIAAKGLDAKLCKVASNWMTAVTSAQP